MCAMAILASLDWPTVASLATAGGTLVLAIATFGSVRSANRSARVAELALQEQRRPVLVQSRLDDPLQKIMFVDGHWVRVEGSRAVAEHIEGTVYLAMSLRNVGAGIGVLQGWVIRAGLQTGQVPHAAEKDFRRQIARPVHPRRRHRPVAGRAARPHRRRPHPDRGGGRPAPDDHDRPALLRSGRRPAHDQPLHAGPRRRRRLAGLGRAALVPRSGRASVRCGGPPARHQAVPASLQ